MSPRETANKWLPGLTLIISIVFFAISLYKSDTQAIEVELKNKPSKDEMKDAIDAAKREMDSKRDADYREFRTDIKYIKEGIDELKKKN